MEIIRYQQLNSFILSEMEPSLFIKYVYFMYIHEKQNCIQI